MRVAQLEHLLTWLDRHVSFETTLVLRAAHQSPAQAEGGQQQAAGESVVRNTHRYGYSSASSSLT